MQKTLKPLALLITTILVLACSLSLTQSPTPGPIPTASVPPPTETATTSAATDIVVPEATGTPVRGVLPVSYNNVKLSVPAGLSTGTTNSTGTDTEFPFTNPSSGPMPEHTKIVLNDYPLQDTLLEPEIMVFAAQDYAAYTDLTQQTVSVLKGLKFTPGQSVPSGLPVGALSAQVHPVSFGDGRGLAYLTQFDQTPLPINNRELIYYFHGLTTDASKYVEVILPVQSEFLAPDENPYSALPSGGVPFKMDQIQAYYDAVAAKLNTALSKQFAPTLPTLDALVQSISTH